MEDPTAVDLGNEFVTGENSEIIHEMDQQEDLMDAEDVAGDEDEDQELGTPKRKYRRRRRSGFNFFASVRFHFRGKSCR